MTENTLSLSGLSIERLNSFCQIVEAGSVVAAAGRNPTKQSQFSRQIRDLERALGVKLFVREGKRLKLTADGVKLSALTNAYFNALREISGANQGAHHPLKLGAAESVIRWLLVPRFTEVVSAAGGPVEMQNHRTSEVVSHLENGQLDLGIIRADARSDALELLPFPVLRYVLMVPRALLPEKSAAGILSVGLLPFVSITGDGQFVRTATKVIEASRLPLNVLSKVESFSLAVEASKVLGAATFVPSEAESEFPTDRFTAVTLEGMDALDRKLAVAFSRKTTELNTRAKQFAVRLSRTFTVGALR